MPVDGTPAWTVVWITQDNGGHLPSLFCGTSSFELVYILPSVVNLVYICAFVRTAGVVLGV